MKPEGRKRKPKPWRIALVGGYFHGRVEEHDFLGASIQHTTLTLTRLVKHDYEFVWHDPLSRQAVAVHVTRTSRGWPHVRAKAISVRPTPKS